MNFLVIIFNENVEKLETVCKGCGKTFDGKGEHFCNNTCRDSHIESLEKIMKDAVKKDGSHTKKLSES